MTAYDKYISFMNKADDFVDTERYQDLKFEFMIILSVVVLACALHWWIKKRRWG